MNELSFGVVVDINDPLKVQRVKVRVMGYYDEIPEEDLPWCQVCRGATETLVFNEGSSSHNIEPGTQVLCAWLDHYHQQPIVLGSVPRASDCTTNRDIKTQRIMMKQGHEVIIGEQGIQINDNRGNHLEVGEGGLLVVIPKGPENKGSMTISVDNEYNVKANSCNIETVDCNLKTTNSKVEAENCEINIKNCNAKIEECKVEVSNCELKCSGDTKIDASSLSMKNIKGPNQFCCLPNCLFAGTKHTAPSTE